MGHLHGAQDSTAWERDRPEETERPIDATEVKRRRLAMTYASSVMDVQIYRQTHERPVTQIDVRPE